jgi:nitroreductase
LQSSEAIPVDAREAGNDPLEPLLSAAGWAPSGDNTQPWRYLVDAQAGQIALLVDETRDPSPMNAGQRMARIAVGAALENLLRAAEGQGWGVDWESASGPALALVRLTGSPGATGAVDEAIVARVTNRRLYEGHPVSAEVLDRLAEETPILDGVRTAWIVDRERIEALAPLIGQADALMFGEPSMRRAFLSKVRFDAPPDAPVAEGLSMASLELTAADRLALRLMPKLPDWLLKLGGVSRVFAEKARQLVASASGLCLVVAPDRTELTDLAVGRAMQRAWLALTRHVLAAQPMMSLCVLENVLEHGRPALVAALGRARVEALSARFRTLVPEVGTGRPGFLLRFGYAPAPSGRTGRLPLSEVTARERSTTGPIPAPSQGTGESRGGTHP